jgi:hypothetical protein
MVIGKPSKLRTLSQSKVVVFIMRSWILAIILGTLIYKLLDFQSEPYLFKQTDVSGLQNASGESRTFYGDLNSDNSSEIYTIRTFTDTTCCLLVKSADAILLDQWNFKGRFTQELLHPMIGDFDHDGLKEISVISLFHNSFLLNIIEPFDKVPIVLKDRLVDTIWTKYGDPFPYLYAAKPADLNHDGTEEVAFSFSSGAARQPRKIYAYDIRADRFWSSPYGGSNLSSISTTDIDQDGKLEIIGTCTAPNNYIDEEIPLQDNCSWFIVLDEQLNYKVPPVMTGSKFVLTTPIWIPDEEAESCFVLVTGFKDRNPIIDWYRIMPDYTLKKEPFPYKKSYTHPVDFIKPASGSGGFFHNRWDGSFFINEKGKVFDVKSFPKRGGNIEILNPEDGIKGFEYGFLEDGQSQNISFYSSEGKRMGYIRNISHSGVTSVCWVGKINGTYQIFVSSPILAQWFEVRSYPWQYLQYLFLILLIAASYGFFELIRFTQATEFSRQDLLRREILELQLKTVKNQLDPHFAFNALNGLSYLVLKGDTQKVSEFIDNFSELLRTQLQSSDKAVVRLRNEIEFLANYMALQRIRFDDQIIFKLDIHPDIDTNILVPKTIIQAHVENALKHGLRPKFLKGGTDHGIVKVTILPSKENIVIQVEDNGVGRGSEIYYSEENNGKGLQVLDQIYSAVNQLYKMKVLQHFEDLYDSNGKPSGTRVNIKITYR